MKKLISELVFRLIILIGLISFLVALVNSLLNKL